MGFYKNFIQIKMKKETKYFLEVSGSILAFFMLIGFSGGMNQESIRELGYFGWLITIILFSFILSAIYVYLLKGIIGKSKNFLKNRFIDENSVFTK